MPQDPTIVERGKASRPDGVFCPNDLLAVGVLQSFSGRACLDIPGELALVGYDDIDFASATVVPLTSISQPSDLISRTAVDLLVEQLEAEPGMAEARQVLFQPELVIRESSRRR